MKLYDPIEAAEQLRLAASAPVYADKVSAERPKFPRVIRTEPGRSARYSRREWKRLVTEIKR